MVKIERGDLATQDSWDDDEFTLVRSRKKMRMEKRVLKEYNGRETGEVFLTRESDWISRKSLTLLLKARTVSEMNLASQMQV